MKKLFIPLTMLVFLIFSACTEDNSIEELENESRIQLIEKDEIDEPNDRDD